MRVLILAGGKGVRLAPRSQGSIATIGAYECQVKIDLGVIIKNGHGRIRDYLEKPTNTHLVSMECMFLSLKCCSLWEVRGISIFLIW